MRPSGQTKLGFFPLPIGEATRLKNCLSFQEQFGAINPCVGDGVAFAQLLRGFSVHNYGGDVVTDEMTTSSSKVAQLAFQGNRAQAERNEG